MRWNKLNRQALYFFHCFLIYIYVYMIIYVHIISYIFIWFGGLLSESTWKDWLVSEKKIKRCFIAIHSNASRFFHTCLHPLSAGKDWNHRRINQRLLCLFEAPKTTPGCHGVSWKPTKFFMSPMQTNPKDALTALETCNWPDVWKMYQWYPHQRWLWLHVSPCLKLAGSTESQ